MESIVVLDDREGLEEFLEEAELKQYFELFRDILKVSKLSQLKFVENEDLAQIGLSKPEQRRYKKMYSKHFPNPYINKIKKFLNTHKKHDQFLHGHCSMPAEYQPFAECSVKIPTKHIIPIEDITLNKELGTGQFGVVQQGTWSTGSQRLQVAIKCLVNERMTSNSTEFLKEAAVMHSIEHPNIVRLYGVVLHMDSLMLVTELAPLRSLLECLREVSLRPNFPVPNLCEFAEQICSGMTYLENKRLIHRDLAARNILVFNKDRVKISDFGLSRALGAGKDYYQSNYNVNLKLPVAWCAPECILFLRFTSSSDVWAFGVCLWEMFTYGFQPWAAFSGQQILENIDMPNNQRLERPDCCPEDYYSVMIECWAHEPYERPRFKDLGVKLRAIRPEQVQTIACFSKSGKGRRNNLLDYKAGEIITVLGKENMTNTLFWYGVLPGGACGLFDPSNTKQYIPKAEKMSSMPGSISPRSIRDSVRCSLLRSDVKRHTYTGKRTIERPLISGPQGEVKHTGHVGLDGAFFGDISFLDPAGCPPRQVVTPYKPSEDLEQVPLINPNSPSHLTVCPYPLLANKPDSSCKDGETKTSKKQNSKSISEPTTSKSIINKMKSATLGRSHKNDDTMYPSTSKTDEVHEYHEISDTDTETNEHHKSGPPESPGIAKSSADFCQSLLDEMESMFKSLDAKAQKAEASSSKNVDIESTGRSHTMSKLEKKKGYQSGTMKPMSAHDEKTLNTAVALANEIINKSMNDVDNSSKVPQSPSEKTKFQFKFPLSLHNASDGEKDVNGKHEPRRNFSEEARSVPNIQESLTEESKQAYMSLIEQPSTSSLISHLPKDSKDMPKPSTIPKPARSSTQSKQFNSLQSCSSHHNSRSSPGNINDDNDSSDDDNKNPIPLPPRTSKPKLIDRPRHIRKYPLKLPTAESNPKIPKRPIIYQNTVSCAAMDRYRKEMMNNHTHQVAVDNGIDVFDGVDNSNLNLVDTNPFTGSSKASTSSANPFICLDTVDGREIERDQFIAERSLVKDYVSVEDLLEFADQKPCGRQRGVESDEVRIMSKVLKEQVTSEECLEALELSDWNVHRAIKLIRVRVAVGSDVTLGACSEQLRAADGDIVKASAVLILCNKRE